MGAAATTCVKVSAMFVRNLAGLDVSNQYVLALLTQRRTLLKKSSCSVALMYASSIGLLCAHA
jgi:hypothetical protein